MSSKFYTCGCCKHERILTGATTGAIGDGVIYCPECTEKLHNKELAMWDEFRAKYNTLPTARQLAYLHKSVWSNTNQEV